MAKWKLKWQIPKEAVCGGVFFVYVCPCMSSLYMSMYPLPPHTCACFCIYVEARSQLLVLFLRNLTFQPFVSYLTSNALISLTCLALSPWESPLSPPSAGITGVSYHIRLYSVVPGD